MDHEILNQDIFSSLNSVVSEVSLMNSKQIVYPYSRAAAFKKLHNLILKKYPAVSQDLLEELLDKGAISLSKGEVPTEQFKEFLSSLEKVDNQYFFITVLNHIQVKEDVEIGLIHFQNLDESKIVKLQAKFNHPQFEGYIHKDVIICGPIQENSFKAAREKGSKMTQEFLNILRLIFDFIEDGHSGFKTHFGISTHVYGQYASFNESFFFPESTWSRLVPISKKMFESPNSKILIDFWMKVGSPGPRSEIEQRFMDAIHWFGIAKMSNDNKQQFTAYFTLLEALLFAGSVGTKTSDLAERITKIFFYGNDTIFRIKKTYYDKIRELYALRGKLVHEAKTHISQDDLASLNTIARETIIKFLALSKEHKINTKKDLTEWVLGQKI